MQNRNIFIVIGALFIAGIAVLLANAYLTGVEERAETVAAEQELTRIVVATQEMDFGDPLTPEKIRLQNFPANAVPQGAFRTIRDALADNRVVLRPIVPGEPILADKVSGLDGRAVLAANLPEDMRAVAIPIGATTGVAGFVRPGDTVDVLLTRKIPGEGAKAEDLMSEVILNRVKVLAIDQIASEKATEPAVGGTATLQVEPFQAQQLAIASRLGTLSLVLRNVESLAVVEDQIVTARDVSQSRLYIPARREPRQAAAQQAPPTTIRVVNDATPRTTATAPVAIRASGPTMTIFRGTEGEDYAVGRLGGN